MTTTVAGLTIRFHFTRNEETKEFTHEFDSFTDSLGDDVDSWADDKLDELNDDLDDDSDDDWEFQLHEVFDYDDEFADPDSFSDLNDYGEYAELVEEHGEAYHYRYQDTGCDGRQFQEDYQGCWASAGEYAEHYCDDCMDIPSGVKPYFDYDKFAGDLMMDYSEYEGTDGIHIFCDN